MGDGTTTSSKIIAWGEAHEGDFKKIYESVVTTWTASCKTASEISSLNELKVFDDVTLKNSFDDEAKDKSMAEILTLAETIKGSADQVKALDERIDAYVTGKDDSIFASWVGCDEETWTKSSSYKGTSSFRLSVDGSGENTLLKQVLAGAKASEVASEDALDDLYEEDLASYKAQALAVVDQSYKAIVTSITDVAKKNALDKAYALVMSGEALMVTYDKNNVITAVEKYTEDKTSGDGTTYLKFENKLDSFASTGMWLKIAQSALQLSIK